MSPGNKKKPNKGKIAMPTSAHTKSSPPANIITAPTTEISPPLHVVFRDFIKLADINTITCFLTTATSTLESENLEALWKRAYEEGYENGRKSLLPDIGRKLEERFEEGIERGMDLGREEGYTVAKEGFDGIVKGLRAREAQKSSTAGTSAQTDPPATTTTSISVQTDLPTIPTHANTLNEHPDHPEPAKSPVSERFNWADDAASLPATRTVPNSLPPRNFSDLRSSKQNPFSSLQRRSKHQKTHQFHRSHRRQSPFNYNFMSSPSHISFKSPYQPGSPSLDWESNPCLTDLSRALRALGWIRAPQALS
jgi:hypothetical protein